MGETIECDDESFMRAALDEARAALACGEVAVGAVFVNAARHIVARAHNRTTRDCNATRHAELVAIDAWAATHGNASGLAGTTLYVTVEPCIMCAAALAVLPIGRVVFGAANDKFGGCGSVMRLHDGFGADGRGGADSPVDVVPHTPPLPAFAVRGGVLRDDAVALLQSFYSRGNMRAPEPRVRPAAQDPRAAASPLAVPAAVGPEPEPEPGT